MEGSNLGLNTNLKTKNVRSARGDSAGLFIELFTAPRGSRKLVRARTRDLGISFSLEDTLHWSLVE